MRPLRTSSQARRKFDIGALLAAALEDALVLLDRVAHGPALGDGQRQRLLAIDVLAGLRRQDDGHGVPVVRRADQDGVDVLAIEQFAEIDEGVAALVLARLLVGGVMLLDETPGRFTAGDGAIPVAGAFAVDVADGHDLHAVIAEEAAHVVEALIAGADDAEIDALARGRLALQAEGRGGDDQRCGGDGGLAEKLPARGAVVSHEGVPSGGAGILRKGAVPAPDAARRTADLSQMNAFWEHDFNTSHQR